MTGAEGRTRTDTVSLPRDFESRASASFATSAAPLNFSFNRLTEWLKISSKISIFASIFVVIIDNEYLNRANLSYRSFVFEGKGAYMFVVIKNQLILFWALLFVLPTNLQGQAPYFIDKPVGDSQETVILLEKWSNGKSDNEKLTSLARDLLSAHNVIRLVSSGGKQKGATPIHGCLESLANVRKILKEKSLFIEAKEAKYKSKPPADRALYYCFELLEKFFVMLKRRIKEDKFVIAAHEEAQKRKQAGDSLDELYTKFLRKNPLKEAKGTLKITPNNQLKLRVIVSVGDETKLNNEISLHPDQLDSVISKIKNALIITTNQ